MRTLPALAPFALAAALGIVGVLAQAARADDAQATPVGRWRTIDDETKKPKSVVAIREEQDGRLSGTVEQLLDPKPDDPNPVCKKCDGDRRNQPILGMKILWSMKKEGSTWTGGKILDPNNGKIYRCNLTLKDGGKKLDVRGYIGISLIGRTQTWIRETDAP